MGLSDIIEELEKAKGARYYPKYMDEPWGADFNAGYNEGRKDGLALALRLIK